MTTVSEQVKSIIDSMKAEQAREVEGETSMDSFSRTFRAERDALWDAIELLASTIDRIHPISPED